MRLVCKSRTEAKAALDLWPTLPIVIEATFDWDGDEGDIIGALEYRDSVAGITLRGLTASRLEKCVALMQETFPILAYLSLYMADNKGSAFPISGVFLGGSAPRLQKLCLFGIRFSTLPNFLSSASDLVDLTLGDISTTSSGHISLEAMALSPSVSIRLRSLKLDFKGSSSYMTSQGPFPSTPSVLTALTYIELRGPYGWLEDIVSRIDAPRLDSGSFEFRDEPTFGAPRLAHFIHRTEKFKSLRLADVYFRHEGALLYFRSPDGFESRGISLAYPRSIGLIHPLG